MIRVRHHVTALGAVLLLATAVDAGAPTDVVRKNVEQALEILSKTGPQGEAQAAQRRDSLRQVANEAFDFPEMAKRTLGQHWRTRTPEERERFTRLFTALLERVYFSRIDTYQSGNTVKYLAEEIQGDSATVKTNVITEKGSEIPVDYHLHPVDGRWRVHDVKVEGVSLVANYRAQFNKVIVSNSFEELLRRLEERSTVTPVASPPGS